MSDKIVVKLGIAALIIAYSVVIWFITMQEYVMALIIVLFSVRLIEGTICLYNYTKDDETRGHDTL